jgi:hypothetical protein
MPAETLEGHAMDQGWVPHKPDTWQYKFATLRKPVEMWNYKQRWVGNEPQFDKVMCPAGTRVKIVMVSRFGDVGITEDLTKETGYGARVPLEDLCDFGETE